MMIALVPMLTWGSIGLVSGKMGGSANQQTLGMTFGACVFSLGTFLLVHPQVDWLILLVGLLSGLCWSVGQNQQFHGMKYLGVSVALPLSTGMQLIINTLAGALFFREWRTTMDFLLGFLALSLLIGGAYLTAFTDKRPENPQTGQLLNFQKGLRALVFSTLGYVLYTIIIRLANLEPLAIILPQSVGMVLGASLFAYRNVQVNRFVWRNMLSGLLWGIGNICLLFAMQQIGLAVSFSFSQMGIIISTLGGIFILGEQKTKKELISVILGCFLIIFGGILLGYMKA